MAYRVVWPSRNAWWTWVSLRGKCLRTYNSIISRVITTLEDDEGDRRKPFASGIGGSGMSENRGDGKLVVVVYYSG